MNYYTQGLGLNSKLVSVEDDVEALVTSTGTLETDVEALVTAVGTLNTTVGTLNTTMSTPVPDDTELLDQALTVSGGATPSLTMTDIECTGARIVAVQVNNKGASTSLKVNIYGAIDTLAYTDVPETTEVTLNASTATCDIITLTNIPYDKVKVVIANADAGNATTVDAVVRVIV